VLPFLSLLSGDYYFDVAISKPTSHIQFNSRSKIQDDDLF
jgi:hypothetical protein